MKKLALFALFVSSMGLATVATAQDFRVLLKPKQVEALSPEARTSYEKALVKIDKIDTRGAVDELNTAGAAAPDHIELQLLLAKSARAAAENSYGEESAKFFDYAESALRRLLANPNLGPEERTRVTRESERVRTGKETLTARDDKRRESGFALVLKVRDERLLKSGADAKKAEIVSQSIDGVLKQQEEAAKAEENSKINLLKSDIWAKFGAPGQPTPTPVPGPPGAAGGIPGGAGFEGADPFAGRGEVPPADVLPDGGAIGEGK